MGTHTFAELEVSEGAYDEIAQKLKDAGYEHAFIGGTIDMHGIGLTKGQPIPKGQISDGYHTFDELYEHRYLLFLALLDVWKEDCDYEWLPWKSKTHWMDGKLVPVWDGWFVAGMMTRTGQITYHLPIKYWDKCNVEHLEEMPAYDGHSSQDVLQRLEAFLTWQPS